MPTDSIEMTQAEFNHLSPALKSARIVNMKLVPVVFVNGKWLFVRDPEEERKKREDGCREYQAGRRRV
jgi:hypothetical protein